MIASYIGRYEFAPGLAIAVARKGAGLTVQLTGQNALEVIPRSKTKWDCKLVDATITFKRNRAGECTALELFQNGVRQTAKRLP